MKKIYKAGKRNNKRIRRGIRKLRQRKEEEKKRKRKKYKRKHQKRIT